jgi:membrane protein YdbS with pleckstrin-like domain
MKQLHQGAKWIFRIRTYFSLLFIMILLASFILPIIMSASETATRDSFLSNLFIFLLLSVVIAVIFGEIYSKLAYKNWKYELTSREVKLERGIIWKKYSAIPFERVQNIDIHRGILARMLGFSTLNIQTAGYHMASQGGMVSEGYIPAVSIKEAEEIREFLIKKIGKRQGL